MTTDFVTALYEDVLMRPPDASGQAYFANQLATGTTPYGVALEIWQSAEHRGLQIDGYYQTFLHRAPDAAGRQFWIDNMLNGAGEVSVMTEILTSPEYLQAHPPMKPFVDGLYQDLLGRAPDPVGLGTWLQVLESRPGTTPGPLSPADEAFVEAVQRPIVAQGIIDSTERETKVIDSYYVDYLHRAADPDGEAFWLQQFTVGSIETITATFLSSQEYLADHPI